jgi:hypothetical protein
MGIFDFFTGGSPEKQIVKHGARIRKKDAQAEDRQASAYWLAEDASVPAIVALLGRFEMTYEHHMKDEAEKEMVADLIKDLDKQAIPALEIFLRRCKNFARPLALLQQIAGQEGAIVVLLELIATEAEKSELKPEKKRQLLITLAEFQDARGEVTAIEMLKDFDEGVRYAAAEVLIGLEETEALRTALLEAVANPKEESNRLRVRIAEVAGGRTWSLGPHAPHLQDHPPTGWAVQGDRLASAPV